ncbi:major capsid protein [Blackfly microvirus SF02]|uniref:Major capsid protein n=1 Tax=Blackfly microvirus SF02 TaxID=2576452 RepID=A0A4P8PM15_9VIRU|nr:major capsid protein [Blackfly microvirus SF02]
MSLHQPQRNLVSQADSATIENAQVPRSKFHNQWSRKTTFDAGKLYPILVDEILPGDHMNYSITAYVRITTLLFPMFDSQRIDTHFFFVPCRLVWDNWVRFMGEQDAPSSPAPDSFSVPQVSVGSDASIGSIYDHYGIPTWTAQLAAVIQINSMPFRAYNLIYNTWFRDQNIQDPFTLRKGDTGDISTDFNIAYRAKSHDYFTSALPWPQKFTAPTVPIGGLAPVHGFGVAGAHTTAGGLSVAETQGIRTYTSGLQDLNNNFVMEYDLPSSLPKIYADLAATSGVAINTLRQAWLVQQLLERDARGGTRYVELIRSHFGVTNPDFRLQRPEYIGGGQSPLNITPIAQTAPTAGQPLGALGAAGTSGGTHRASYAATEHGYVIGLLSVKSELSYQQGIPKLFDRKSRYDFYWPTLAGLGEQAIKRREIYATGLPNNDDLIFGYQERWQEYRTRQSDITGLMRSSAGAGTYDGWHLAQNFVAPPVLNSAFIVDAPPMPRVLAAATLATNQQYQADIMYQRTAVRPIPTYGTPVTLGRF